MMMMMTMTTHESRSSRTTRSSWYVVGGEFLGHQFEGMGFYIRPVDGWNQFSWRITVRHSLDDWFLSRRDVWRGEAFRSTEPIIFSYSDDPRSKRAPLQMWFDVFFCQQKTTRPWWQWRKKRYTANICKSKYELIEFQKEQDLLKQSSSHCMTIQKGACGWFRGNRKDVIT